MDHNFSDLALNLNESQGCGAAFARLGQKTDFAGKRAIGIGWAVSTDERTFTKDAKRRERFETPETLASLAKEQSRVGDRN